jgi:hypothetical protein
MPKIAPNPSVPVLVDPVTGTVETPISQAQGVAVVAELKGSGSLYEVPAGKTFTGIAVLLVGAHSGLVEIEDASSNVLHSAGGATGQAVTPAITNITSAGGGEGNQLSVALASGAEVVSAVIAGYVR